MNDIDRGITSTRDTMLGLVSGFHVSRALFVAARLGIADLLAKGPRPCDALAKDTGADPPALLRILRLLAAVGVVTVDGSCEVALTPLGETLRSDATRSLRGWVIGQLGEQCYRAWGEILHSVRTGGIAFDRAFGTDVWSHRAANPEEAREFDEAMVSYVAATNEAVIASGVFAASGIVVDVAGGEGALLLAILREYPKALGVLFEQPHVARRAELRVAASALAPRCRVLEGDALKGVPGGGDSYILSRVIHDWDDAGAATILVNCRRAMAPGARLLLVERILPERIQAGLAAQLVTTSDVHMMAMNGGRERTEGEYRALLEAAGFRFVRRHSTGSPVDVLESEAW
jgi:SAM-dependent methyltransferase